MSRFSLARSLGSGLLDWLYPPRCGACDAPLMPGDHGFCAVCGVSLLPLAGSRCQRCGVPGPPLCTTCRSAPPPFARVRSGYLYGGALAQAIRRYKFHRHLELSAPLAALLLPVLVPVEGLLVPVPSSAAALRRRGFDVVAEILRAVVRQAARQGEAVRWAAVLRRGDHRAPQVTLSAAARRRLGARAFRVVGPSRVRAARIVLVDDVITTGATLRACSAALKLAGAARVEVVSLARAEREG